MERTQRQLKVGEEVRHIIVDTLQKGRFHDEALLDARTITVTEVRVSPDLKHATAYVLSLGGRDMEDILPALNEASSYFQKQINLNIRLKNVPKVHFVKDESFEQADKIETILKNIPKSDT